MEKELKISYYKPSDELNIFLGDIKESVLAEIDNEIYVRLDPKTNKVLGLTILNFQHRIKKGCQTIPVIGNFILPKRTKDLIVS